MITPELINVPKWITIVPYAGNANGFWKIVKAEYIAPGNAVCYAIAEMEDGSPAIGYKAVQKNGGITPLGFELKQGYDGLEHAEATFPMTGNSSFRPDLGQVGPYSIEMFGQSDVAKGIGLPFPSQHVEYHFTFRWVENTSQPPAPPEPGVCLTRQEVQAMIDDSLNAMLERAKK